MSARAAFESIKGLFRVRDDELASTMLYKIDPSFNFRLHAPWREVTVSQILLRVRDRDGL